VGLVFSREAAVNERSEELLSTFQAETTRLNAEANAMIFQIESHTNRLQAMYFRDGVTATTSRLLTFLDNYLKEANL